MPHINRCGAINYAHALKIEALARLGELLRVAPKAKGAEGIGKSASAVPERYRTQPPTLANLGLSKKTSVIAQRPAGLPPIVAPLSHTPERCWRTANTIGTRTRPSPWPTP
jgi:hypothetical protein